MPTRASDGTSARADRLRNAETHPAELPSAKDMEAVGTALPEGQAAVIVGTGDGGRVLGRVLAPVTRFSKDGRRLADELAVVSPTTGESVWRNAEGQPVTAGATVAIPMAKGRKVSATHPTVVAIAFSDGTFTSLPMSGAGMRTYSTGVVEVEMNGTLYSAEVRIKVRNDSWLIAVAHVFSGGRLETSGRQLVEESTLLLPRR
jgi:hypothetical protein